MEDFTDGLIEATAPGADKIDRAWMTTFWEAFSDAVIEIDAGYHVTNILRKTDSTFTMTDIIGKSFLDIVTDKDREQAAKELDLLRTTDVPYRRFTFPSKQGRYYRWTLIAQHNDGVFAGLRGIAVDVTEQSLNELTLNWQRAIIEGSNDFVSIADMDGHVLYTNPGAYKMTGYDPSSGELPTESLFTPEHLELISGEGLEIAVASGLWVNQSKLVCADGSTIPIEHSMFSVRNDQDEAILIATIIRDITDFVEHEKTIRNEQRQTEMLASVAMSFSLSDDFDATIDEALASIGGFMDVDSMYICRDDGERQCFVRDYLWTNDKSRSAHAHQLIPYIDPSTGEYTREYTLLQRAPIFVSNDLWAPGNRFFIRLREIGVKSIVCMPIHIEDRFWGYIGLNMYIANRIWTERDIRFIETICGILSTSLEKRLMLQRWQDSQANLQAVVGNYPGIIWSLDSQRRFTLFDGAALAAMEDIPADVVGRNIRDFIDQNPGLLHSSMLDKVELTFSGEPQDWMIELEDAVFRCNTMPILDAGGVIIGVVGALADVTGMIRLQKELEEARIAAEAASVAKSEFLSRMSHEIRTPMNAIIGMTQIAQNSGEPERVMSCLDKIDAASEHLLALINDILDISKIEANKLELQNTTFDLGGCIENIRVMIAVRAEEKKQTFSLRFSDTLPGYLVGDELRLTQVIINLLGNAIKFTPENGSISLDISERGRENGECVLEVRVSDNGIGITPEHQSKLFTPFEQGDGSITREYGGTGLGLAICKYIVELMGGGIWVESVLGEGSMFAFSVRMRISDEEAYRRSGTAKNAVGEVSAAGVDNLSEFTILLVEDVEINREIVFAMLEDTHARIDFAENGAIAVEMFAAAPDLYDIILMDMQMPVMDGLEATRRIRALDAERAGSIAIVAMTANVFKEDVDKCLAAGMNDHIAKPIDSDLLLEKLIHYLFMSGYVPRG